QIGWIELLVLHTRRLTRQWKKFLHQFDSQLIGFVCRIAEKVNIPGDPREASRIAAVSSKSSNQCFRDLRTTLRCSPFLHVLLDLEMCLPAIGFREGFQLLWRKLLETPSQHDYRLSADFVVWIVQRPYQKIKQALLDPRIQEL